MARTGATFAIDVSTPSGAPPSGLVFKELRQPTSRVLIVDDTEENIDYMQRVLSRAGVDTVSAMSGLEALCLIENSHSFDLIFMDIQMPVMDGLAALAALREKGIETPIIAMTASSMSQLKEKSDRFAFDGYLSKPSMVQDILDLLQAFLSDGAGEETKSNETARTDHRS